ncbi:MAG: PA domain-containing protein, partial [Pseudomonadota bacterium]
MPARRTYSQALRAAGLFTVVLAFSLWAAADQPRLRWIVELDTRPLAMVDHNEALKQSEVLSPEQALAQSLSQIEPRLRRDIVPAHTYRHVTTGFALALTEAEANELADLPAVLRVTPDTLLPLDVPRSSGVAQGGCSLLAGTGAPEPVTRLIGAVDVWNGALPDGLVHLGEGVIVGVVGDGIRGDHPSFAALGDDGYQHINPYGSGVYVGECFATPELVCNDKLIGRYDFTGDTSEDDSGYSTFLSSIAVGNRLSGDTVAGTGLALVAGVAPHANLIAYRACAPSCALSAIISAFDQAVADGVDVLLYPIGSNSESPWTSLLSLVARSLRAAGVVVVSSTGSAGPEPGSLNLSMAAPWVVSANPSTHGLDHYAKMLGKFAGGASVPPPALTGRARGEGISRRIVYAGSIPNPAAPGEDPAQCLTPYPAGVLNGEILVCDRGQISRAQKSRNARDSGAGGFVLANVSGGLSSLASDNYAIPGIHIDADAATTLRAWLATGQGHRATISGTMLAENSLLEDRLSGAASRGPNLGLSYLAPTLTAPAFDITGAAGAPPRGTDGAAARGRGGSRGARPRRRDAAPRGAGALAAAATAGASA